MREDGIAEEHHYEGSDGIREEMRHFMDCVALDKEPLSTGVDGRKALEIALCCIESIRNRKIVTLGSG
jgi:predicted dehydrogenase